MIKKAGRPLTKMLGVKCDPQLLKEIDAAARADGRTRSSFTRWAITVALRKQRRGIVCAIFAVLLTGCAARATHSSLTMAFIHGFVEECHFVDATCDPSIASCDPTAGRTCVTTQAGPPDKAVIAAEGVAIAGIVTAIAMIVI